MLYCIKFLSFTPHSSLSQSHSHCTLSRKMSRRRLRTVYTSSSDEEGNLHQSQPQNPNPNIPQFDHLQPQHHNTPQNAVFHEPMFEEDDEIDTPSQTLIPNIDSVTLNSSHSTPTTTTAIPEPPSVGNSDEEFIDAVDNLSSSNPPPPAQPASTSFIASDCPVNDNLRRLGLNLRREWLDSCKLGLQNAVSGFANFDVETKAKLCFGQFLNSDMNYAGAGILPENVHQLHLVDLAGPFVLQVDEVINISCPLRERYKNAFAGPKRCLKLSMTDGVQRVFGMEYRPIRNLEALAPAGFKVVIRNVNVRRGLLMLVPEVLEILGGSVEELEAARQRLVHEVNKPPKGKRTRNGIVPPLSTRATLAAWGQTDTSNIAMPQNDANNVPRNAANSMLHAATPFQESTPGVLISGSRPASHAGTNLGRSNQHSLSITEPSNLGRSDQRSLSRESGQNNIIRESAQLSSIGDHVLSTDADVSEPLYGRESSLCLISRETAQGSVNVEAHGIPTDTDAPEQVPAGEFSEIHSISAAVDHSEDAHMFHYMENPSILTGEKEMPFTYLASLSAKWDAVHENEPFVRGNIKCFLTGVKKFQHKGRSTFKLLVYVDDGSLISEILIHHDVVQKAIGYSPKEVSAALSSSDAVVTEDMKNTLKRFQIFLINFEGTMLVELNVTSTIPVALEMSQGCSTSDAWSLLQRLKPDTSKPLSRNGQSDVINLSP